MTDPESLALMTQAADAFEAAGAPPSLRELALASLDEPEAGERFAMAVEAFCSAIDAPEGAASARVALHLASRAAMARKAALAGASRLSRQASGAVMSYLSNSSPEG